MSKLFCISLLELNGFRGPHSIPNIAHRHLLGVVEAEDLEVIARKLGAADRFQTEMRGGDPDAMPDWKLLYYPFAAAVGSFQVSKVEELIASFIGICCPDPVQTFRDLVNFGEPLSSARRYLCLFGEVPRFC